MPKRPELPEDLFDLPIDTANPDTARESEPESEPESVVESAESEDNTPVEDGSASAHESQDAELLETSADVRGVDSASVDLERAGRAGRAGGSARDLPLFDGVIDGEDGPETETAGSAGTRAVAVSRAAAPAASMPTSGPPSGIFDQLPDPELEVDRQEHLALDDSRADVHSEEDGEQELELEAAGFLVRLQAGAADLLAHLAVLSSALVAMRLLGLTPGVEQWPGFVSFLALFSFLYLAFPLAFWGHTPGMAWFGLVARDQGDRPLAFGQTGVRVLASWLTIALAGLPLLLAFTGRSLADRLSGSETWVAERDS